MFHYTNDDNDDTQMFCWQYRSCSIRTAFRDIKVIGQNVVIGYNLVIGHNVVIGYKVVIGHTVVIWHKMVIGQNVVIGHIVGIGHKVVVGHNVVTGHNVMWLYLKNTTRLVREWKKNGKRRQWFEPLTPVRQATARSRKTNAVSTQHHHVSHDRPHISVTYHFRACSLRCSLFCNFHRHLSSLNFTHLNKVSHQ